MKARAASERARPSARRKPADRRPRAKPKKPHAPDRPPALWNPDTWRTAAGNPMPDDVRRRAVRVLSDMANGRRYSKALTRARVPHATWNAMLRHYPALDADYKAATQAQHEIRRILRVEAADERAVDGWEKPVFYEGAKVGTERCYSDRLLEKLLVADDPARFADRLDQHVSGSMVWESATPLPKRRPPGL